MSLTNDPDVQDALAALAAARGRLDRWPKAGKALTDVHCVVEAINHLNAAEQWLGLAGAKPVHQEPEA